MEYTRIEDQVTDIFTKASTKFNEF